MEKQNYLVIGEETRWVDGPLARAVRVGGICYLDKVVEAKKDTTVVIHPLADDRRMPPKEKTGEILEAQADSRHRGPDLYRYRCDLRTGQGIGVQG